MLSTIKLRHVMRWTPHSCPTYNKKLFTPHFTPLFTLYIIIHLLYIYFTLSGSFVTSFSCLRKSI